MGRYGGVSTFILYPRAHVCLQSSVGCSSDKCSHSPNGRSIRLRQAAQLLARILQSDADVVMVGGDFNTWPTDREGFRNPTNIASVNLVRGCPNARAGVRIVGKKTLRATQILTSITNYH